MAHLVNFQRSDTALGVRFANHYYDHPMAGFSVPAADHSTITMWGRARELDAYRNLVRSFAAPGKTVACVSDSFDLYRAVDDFWGDELRDEVRDSGGTVFIWPDSGDPAEGILRCLDILDRKVGTTKNTKGYKVLPRYYRIIQGDGVDPDSIRDIFVAMHGRRYSASNITFGMGGANLQKLHRDTQKFAFKCSEATVAGERVKVWKDPATDSTKRSRGGRLALVREEGHLRTVEGERKDDLLVPVFEDGRVLVRHTFEQVRQNAMRGLV
jgi:nicotinamide phosphoribosyltransferase